MTLFLVIVVLPALIALADGIAMLLPIVVDVDHVNAYLEFLELNAQGPRFAAARAESR